MPKATLLRDSYSTYTAVYGTGTYEFQGGRKKEVPAAVAIELKKKVNKDGSLLFKVEGMPIVLKKFVHPPVKIMAAILEQNVARHSINQLRFEPWH